MTSTSAFTFLSQEESQNFDLEIMGPSFGFSSKQLMELAALSAAQATAEAFPLSLEEGQLRNSKVLVLCGPGNNGGDGLVAARHLTHFGYNVQVFYPKRPEKKIFKFLEVCPSVSDIDSKYDFLLDGIFGHSFKGAGAVRAPFDKVLETLAQVKTPIVSIDVPSGWDVEKGPLDGVPSFTPTVLISLIAPKLCAKGFNGRHYLGGRFVPPALLAKYQLVLPPFTTSSQFVELKSQ